MKLRTICHIAAMLLAVWVMSSCGGDSRAEKQLLVRQAAVDMRVADIQRVLEKSDFDSLWHYTHQDAQVVWYVYAGSRMVYWSESWLSDPVYRLAGSEQWQTAEWGNARGWYRDARCDGYVLRAALVEEVVLDDSEGLMHSTVLGLQPGVMGNLGVEAREQVRWYYGIAGLLGLLLVGYAIKVLVQHRGMRNMPLSNRLQIVLVSTLICTLALVFGVSVWHIKNVFRQEQRERLEETARHVQTQLQDLYFWDMGLGQAHSSSLNIDLKDMHFDYELDIHVYDLNGRLLGSSSPELFMDGVLSQRMSSSAFFSDDVTQVLDEGVGDLQYLTAYTEFVNGNFARIGYIAVPKFMSTDEMHVYVGSYVARLLPLYIVLLLMCIVVLWMVSRMVSRPLMALSEQMQTYRLGDAGYHISYRYNDEVGELINRYNEMLDALAESTNKLARSEREGAWRTMARQVAHEINNSLTPMKLTLQQLQRWKGTERFEQAFDRTASVLIGQIDNMSNIAQSFSSFAKMPEVHVEVVDIARKLYDYIVLLRNESDVVPLRYVGPEQGVEVWADGSQVVQVFQNIVKNAVQAMEGREGSDIIIILKDVPDAQREEKGLSRKEKWVEVSISDNGPGICEEVRDKVFVPNFTTKNTGAGLGLAISRNIVEGCGGKISFQSSEKGTTFFVWLRKGKMKIEK